MNLTFIVVIDALFLCACIHEVAFFVDAIIRYFLENRNIACFRRNIRISLHVCHLGVIISLHTLMLRMNECL